MNSILALSALCNCCFGLGLHVGFQEQTEGLVLTVDTVETLSMHQGLQAASTQAERKEFARVKTFFGKPALQYLRMGHKVNTIIDIPVNHFTAL